MQYFRVSTVVDITRTQVYKDGIDSLKKNQQDNFNTIFQTLEMRGNVYFDEDPQIVETDWSAEGYNTKEKTWIWDVYIEQDDIFKHNNDPCGYMLTDIQFVPFITNCTESADLSLGFFSALKKPVNIKFELVHK